MTHVDYHAVLALTQMRERANVALKHPDSAKVGASTSIPKQLLIGGVF